MKKVSARKSDRKHKKAKAKKPLKLVLSLLALALIAAVPVVLGLQENQPKNHTTQDQAEIEQIEDSVESTPDENAPASNQVRPRSTKNRKNTTTNTQNNQQSCTQTELPYKTVQLYVSRLQKGTFEEKPGRNGLSLDCGDGSPVVTSPIDQIIYVGTGLTDAEIEQQRIDAMNEYDRKYMLWTQTRATAYQHCMNGMAPDYPYKESFCTSQANQQAGPPPQR